MVLKSCMASFLRSAPSVYLYSLEKIFYAQKSLLPADKCLYIPEVH